MKLFPLDGLSTKVFNRGLHLESFEAPKTFMEILIKQ